MGDNIVTLVAVWTMTFVMSLSAFNLMDFFRRRTPR